MATSPAPTPPVDALALVIDANVAIAISAREADRDVCATAEISHYSA